MSELKVTGLTRLPANYNGEPLIFIIDITDKNGDMYESEIHMDKGFSKEDLLEACKESFLMCDATVTRVHVRSVRIKNN